MNVKHETNIDTVAVQLDFKTALEQRNKFNLIYNWIIGRGLGILKDNKDKSSHRVRVYDLMSGKSKLATLHTSFSNNFYIRIRWCGLKSFKRKHDEAFFASLVTICAWLNTTRTFYRFVELDIALDLFCPFSKVLFTCVKPVNNVLYNPIGFLQYYKNVPTNYIEDYKDKKKRKYAIRRSYQYDKSNKEGLDYFVTRCEWKLQNRFFLRYGFNLNSISSVLNKYAVFYFDKSQDKQLEVHKMRSKRNLDYLDLFRLEHKYNRVYADLDVVKKFIWQVETVFVDYYGNIVLSSEPTKSGNNFF